MRGGTIHFLHQDFGSSVFAAPGKCSKSGNASFAAVPAPEHINILEKFMYVRVCADMQPPTISLCVCVCVCRQTQERGVCERQRGYQKADEILSRCDRSQHLGVGSGETAPRFGAIKT